MSKNLRGANTCTPVYEWPRVFADFHFLRIRRFIYIKLQHNIAT